VFVGDADGQVRVDVLVSRDVGVHDDERTQVAREEAACIVRHLSGLLSPHPRDLEPIQPVAVFDLSRYAFEQNIDVAAKLGDPPNLLNLGPAEFEHLVRQLLERRGLQAWVTRAADTRGVDVVGIDNTGGLCIIQAKRYSKVVGLDAIHSLAGIVEDQHAAKGILVTTSWVGKASRDFAARNGKIEIIEGPQLKSMLHEHLGLDVEIGLHNP
jgi:restriction system protein